MQIARRIRKLRRQNSLSLAEVAVKAHVGLCFLAQLENGEDVATWEEIEKLAAALDVPVFQLFYSDEEPPLTPHLTPRLTIEQVAEEAEEASSGELPEPAPLAKAKILQSAIRCVLSLRMRTGSAARLIRLPGPKVRPRTSSSKPNEHHS
jgi:transcriptional regulator with XRE-family HTH domain